MAVATTICPQDVTLTLSLSDMSVLKEIKKALKLFKGVDSVKVLSPTKKEQLNSTTIKAIEDVKAGKTFKASSVDDLIAQCLN